MSLWHNKINISPKVIKALSFSQLYVQARRQFEVTEQIANAIVNITVRRNEFAPRFEQSEYRRDNLLETTTVGSAIVTVKATDQDGVSGWTDDPLSACFCITGPLWESVGSPPTGRVTRGFDVLFVLCLNEWFIK